MKTNYFITADAKAGLATLPDSSINCSISSPPYYALRDYGVVGQYGLENTPEEYIENQVQVYEGVKRVLRDDGTCWIVIGDSYWGGKGLSWAPAPDYQAMRSHLGISMNKKYQQVGTGPGKVRITDRKHPVIKKKDLIGIPWTLAFALRDYGAKDLKALKVLAQVMAKLEAAYDGIGVPDKVLFTLEELEKEYAQAKGNSWYLRQDCIWSKPNPMPESMEDRCTRSHEYIFLLAKNGSRNIWWRARDTRIWTQTKPDIAETCMHNGKKVLRWRGYKYYFDGDAIQTPYVLPGINGNPKHKVKGLKISLDYCCQAN